MIPDGIDFDALDENERNEVIERAIFEVAANPRHPNFAKMATLWAKSKMGWGATLSKKEQAARAAETAGEDSDWGDDLNPWKSH